MTRGTSYFDGRWDPINLFKRVGKEPDTIKWGKRGSRIEGSVYVRDFCRICVEPIRVSKAVIGSESPCCNVCKGKVLSSGSWSKEIWWSDYRYHGDYYE